MDIYMFMFIYLNLRKRNHVEVGKDASRAHEHALKKLTSSKFTRTMTKWWVRYTPGFLKIKERMIFMVRYTDAMLYRNYKYEKSR